MKINITKKKLREFGILIGIVIPIIWGFLFPYIGGKHFRFWTLIVGILSLSCAIIYPKLLKYPYKIWMLIGTWLGWINSRLILSLVYLLILIPISLVMKIFGYDPLKIKNNKPYRQIIIDKKVDLTRVF